MTTRTDLVEQRLDMVRRFEESGMTAAAFAREEGVSVGTLSSWRKRAARQAAFVPVTVVPDGAAGFAPSPIMRVQIDALAIEIMPGADPTEIASIVRALTC